MCWKEDPLLLWFRGSNAVKTSFYQSQLIYGNKRLAVSYFTTVNIFQVKKK